MNRSCRNYLALTGGKSVIDFSTQRLPLDPDIVATDGTNVRVLPRLAGGGMAHFELPPGETSTAVTHRTVEEIWFFISGRGEMWRRQGNRVEEVQIDPGVCLTIPLGTHFQFRSFGDTSLTALAVTIPPWPGNGEAYPVEGRWVPTVGRNCGKTCLDRVD
jgi:mannose-6-phosphate isomerase-like protein (cupin superfamily)